MFASRIAVVSDTHGYIEPLLDQLNKFHIDELFFLGDCYRDGLQLADRLCIPGQMVRGNVEPFDCPGPADLVIKRNQWTILLTHGHQYRVKTGLTSLAYRGEEIEANLILFGHTHQPFHETVMGKIFFNPGSAGRPNYQGDCSWGLLEFQKDTILLTHHYF